MHIASARTSARTSTYHCCSESSSVTPGRCRRKTPKALPAYRVGVLHSFSYVPVRYSMPIPVSYCTYRNQYTETARQKCRTTSGTIGSRVFAFQDTPVSGNLRTIQSLKFICEYPYISGQSCSKYSSSTINTPCAP